MNNQALHFDLIDEVMDHPFKASANIHDFCPLTPSRRQIWPILDPSLKNADVLNGWPLCKKNIQNQSFYLEIQLFQGPKMKKNQQQKYFHEF